MADVDMAMGLGEDADALSEPLIQEVPTDEAEPMQGAPALPAHDVLMRVFSTACFHVCSGTEVNALTGACGGPLCRDVCPALVHTEQG